MPEQINRDRRELLQAAALGVAAAPLILGNSAHAQSTAGEPTSTPSNSITFAAVKQIDAGVLNVGYVEVGPSDGAAVVLLHG